ncbi:hypothetical protein ACWEPC_19145 [Nonomuraea sp. NPDC004297]
MRTPRSVGAARIFTGRSRSPPPGPGLSISPQLADISEFLKKIRLAFLISAPKLASRKNQWGGRFAVPDNDPPTGGKRTRLLLWSGGVLTAVVAGVITAWATDAVSLLVGPADLVGLGRPALRATVIPVAGRAPDLAVAALPSTPHDRAVFLRGRFSDQAFLDVTAGLGGAWVRRARVRVVFEATRDLRITDVRLKRIGVAQPNVTRAFVQFPSESAARNPQLTLDLNDKAPFFTRLPGSKSPFFGPNSLPVKRGDQTEVGFEIQARSRSHAFALEVFYLSTGAPVKGGEKGHGEDRGTGVGRGQSDIRPELCNFCHAVDWAKARSPGVREGWRTNRLKAHRTGR